VNHVLAQGINVATGTYDYERFVTTEMGIREYSLPDFIVSIGDFHLQSGSACIDTGTESDAPTEDIEGTRRPCGGGTDMGAYEACTTSYLSGDTNGDARFDFADGVYILRYLFAGGLPLPCERAGDINGDCALDSSDALQAIYFWLLRGPPPAGGVGCIEVVPDTCPDLSCEQPGC
jgi:hypothetical protein